MPRVYSRRSTAETPPPDAVYVGRPTKWGNPFVVGKDGSQDACVKAHREWMTYQPRLRQDARRELAGKDLVCWCYPKPCHADTLLEIANSEEGAWTCTENT